MIKKYNFCILINQSKKVFKKPNVPNAWSNDAELNKFYWEFVIIYKLLQYFLQIF